MAFSVGGRVRRLPALGAIALTLAVPLPLTLSSAASAATTPDPALAHVYDLSARSVVVHTAAVSHGILRVPGIGEPPPPSGLRAGFLATEDGTVSFASKAEARSAFEGDLGTAANRFYKGATSKSTDFRATELPGGGQRFEFFSPANNPGYGKLFVQDVDAEGNVIQEYKDTLGPEGLIERKFVHGGP